MMIALAACAWLAVGPAQGPIQSAESLRPRHVTAEIEQAVEKGLEYLKRTQNADGSWRGTSDGAAYPLSMTSLAGLAFLAGGNTPSRGPYAEQVRAALTYIMRCRRQNGLISSTNMEMGRPMYGHGFALTFLATVYGMDNNDARREQMSKIITEGIRLTARAQSPLGGWTYFPGGGDEGSVTVTQIQALRACHNAGFTVPQGTIDKAVRYLEICRTEEGGIRYAAHSPPQTRLAISAAAVATLYNAGEYDSEMAQRCLEYISGQFREGKRFEVDGHAFYAHFYGAQAFYTAGDEHWDPYFPGVSRQLLSRQQSDGHWEGDGIGPIYGTSLAAIILQLPYKFLPIYQR